MVQSAQELSEVLEDEVYVIGGIVDRSVKKSQSLSQAQEQGVKTSEPDIDPETHVSERFSTDFK